MRLLLISSRHWVKDKRVGSYIFKAPLFYHFYTSQYSHYRSIPPPPLSPLPKTTSLFLPFHHNFSLDRFGTIPSQSGLPDLFIARRVCPPPSPPCTSITVSPRGTRAAGRGPGMARELDRERAHPSAVVVPRQFTTSSVGRLRGSARIDVAGARPRPRSRAMGETRGPASRAPGCRGSEDECEYGEGGREWMINGRERLCLIWVWFRGEGAAWPLR